MLESQVMKWGNDLTDEGDWMVDVIEDGLCRMRLLKVTNR